MGFPCSHTRKFEGLCGSHPMDFEGKDSQVHPLLDLLKPSWTVVISHFLRFIHLRWVDVYIDVVDPIDKLLYIASDAGS